MGMTSGGAEGRVARSLWNWIAITIVAVCIAHPIGTLAQSAADASSAQIGTVRVDAGHAINSFDPDSALGSSIDVLSRRDIDMVYSPHIIQESLSAGWGPITYRNNTELRMAAWHWTENGTWSDAAHRSGYFTGSTELKEPIRYILAMRCRTGDFRHQRRPAGAGAESLLLEKQPLSDQQVYRRERCASSPVGDRGFESGQAGERGAYCLGESIRHEVSGGVLGGGRGCARLRRGSQG